MNLSPPSSQKAGERPISFLLDDGAFPTAVELVIRPEELTRTESSRVSVQQTLGSSPWVDNFGPGLTQINISGHTGWRRTESSSMDGLARFQFLNDYVFTKWHEKRQDAARAGLDPDGIKLIFSDALDDFSLAVIPMSFTLRRSKSRPLLCQYQIAMTVSGDSKDQAGYLSMLRKISPVAAISAAAAEAAGLESLTASVEEITSFLDDVKNFVNENILGPVQGFMAKTAKLYGAVRDAISSASQIAGALINTARSIAQAGVNLFRTLAAVANIPSIIKSQLMQVAGAYSNIFCVLSNAMQQRKYIQDYSDVFGSSNCSSTSGGRPMSPLSGINPFFAVVPTLSALPVSITSLAQRGIDALAYSDPVLDPLPEDQLGAACSYVDDGMEVA